MAKSALAAGVVALAAGCANPHPSTTVVETARFASIDAKRSRGTTCHGGARYDRERGCVVEGWGVNVTIRHHDAMGDGFRLIGAAYALDGVLLLDTNDPDLLSRRDFPVLTSPFRPGPHEIAVLLRYQGHGSGVFSYLSGYRFAAKQAFSFDVPSTGSVMVVVVGDEAGDPTVPLEARPRIRLTRSAPTR